MLYAEKWNLQLNAFFTTLMWIVVFFDTDALFVRTLPARRSTYARARAHKKSLVAERYQAFSEAKCLS